MSAISWTVCIPPKFIRWYSSPHGDSTRKRGFGEVIDALGNHPRKLLPPCEDKAGRHVCDPGSGPSHDTEPASVDFPASGTVRSKFLTFTCHLHYGILLK